jgi:hypothetical protein
VIRILLLATFIPQFLYAQGFAYSDNFSVYCPTQELADQVLQKAEINRTNIAKALFNKIFPPKTGVCIIRVGISDTEHHAFTWPAKKKGQFHSINIKSNIKRALGTTLAHEITHTVVATQFPEGIARWANEGIATFQDEPERNEKRRFMLLEYARKNEWPSLEKIVTEKTLTNDEGQFYAIAHSFSDFLLSLEPDSTNTFFLFAQGTKDAETREDIDAAAKKYYGLSLKQLEAQWREWVRGEYGIKPAKPTRPANVSQTPKTATPIQQPLPRKPAASKPSSSDTPLNEYIRRRGYVPERYVITVDSKTGQITLTPLPGMSYPGVILLPE